LGYLKYPLFALNINHQSSAVNFAAARLGKIMRHNQIAPVANSNPVATRAPVAPPRSRASPLASRFQATFRNRSESRAGHTRISSTIPAFDAATLAQRAPDRRGGERPAENCQKPAPQFDNVVCVPAGTTDPAEKAGLAHPRSVVIAALSLLTPRRIAPFSWCWMKITKSPRAPSPFRHCPCCISVGEGQHALSLPGCVRHQQTFSRKRDFHRIGKLTAPDPQHATSSRK